MRSYTFGTLLDVEPKERGSFSTYGWSDAGERRRMPGSAFVQALNGAGTEDCVVGMAIKARRSVPFSVRLLVHKILVIRLYCGLGGMVILACRMAALVRTVRALVAVSTVSAYWSRENLNGRTEEFGGEYDGAVEPAG